MLILVLFQNYLGVEIEPILKAIYYSYRASSTENNSKNR